MGILAQKAYMLRIMRFSEVQATIRAVCQKWVVLGQMVKGYGATGAEIFLVVETLRI